MRTLSVEREKKRKKKKYTNLYYYFSIAVALQLELKCEHEHCYLHWRTDFLYFFLKDDINTIDMEEDKRDLISREISKFRDTHKVKWLLLIL